MRAAALALVLALAAPVCGAVEITSYDVLLRTSIDGSATAFASVGLEKAVPGPIALPLGFAGATGVKLTEGPAGTLVSAEPLNGQSIVRVVLPDGVPSVVTVGFSFPVPDAFVRQKLGPGEKPTLPGGSRLLSHVFVNSQPVPIADYTARVVFPDGLRAHAIRESLPKLGKSEVGPRVQLGEIDSRPGATIHVDRLLQGESASMKLELVSASRSPGWLIVGALLSILYLIYFRDLVARRAE